MRIVASCREARWACGFLAGVLAASGCRSGEPRASATWRTLEVEARDVLVSEPVPEHPRAIVLVLHAYDTSPVVQESFFRLVEPARARGWLLVLPEGRRDGRGKRFWNAGPSCCAFDPAPPDDVGHLSAVIAEVRKLRGAARLPVVAAGVSNGAFMAHRMACVRSLGIRAVVSVAGTAPEEAPPCAGDEAVRVLHVHGTEDQEVRYGGGAFPTLAPYLSAEALVGLWAMRNGCEGPLTVHERLNADRRTWGDETEVLRPARCPRAPVELWRVRGGGHRLTPTPRLLDAVAEVIEHAQSSVER